MVLYFWLPADISQYHTSSALSIRVLSIESVAQLWCSCTHLDTWRGAARSAAPLVSAAAWIAEHLPWLNKPNPSQFHRWICHYQYAGPQVLLQSVPPSSTPLSLPHDSAAILLRLEAITGRPTNSFPILQRQPTLLELEAGPTGEQLSTVTRRDWKLSFKKREKQFVLALSPGNREKLEDCSKNTIWSPLWTNRSKAVGQL